MHLFMLQSKGLNLVISFKMKCVRTLIQVFLCVSSHN
uniref:Uncharacterized protein n=1 Tax=Anguilla anguilla TaxID=7936 RepID=A0A0E9S2Q5_ANGAN